MMPVFRGWTGRPNPQNALSQIPPASPHTWKGSHRLRPGKVKADLLRRTAEKKICVEYQICPSFYIQPMRRRVRTRSGLLIHGRHLATIGNQQHWRKRALC